MQLQLKNLWNFQEVSAVTGTGVNECNEFGKEWYCKETQTREENSMNINISVWISCGHS